MVKEFNIILLSRMPVAESSLKKKKDTQRGGCGGFIVQSSKFKALSDMVTEYVLDMSRLGDGA